MSISQPIGRDVVNATHAESLKLPWYEALGWLCGEVGRDKLAEIGMNEIGTTPYSSASSFAGPESEAYLLTEPTGREPRRFVQSLLKLRS
jgi:hypothetical protein